MFKNFSRCCDQRLLKKLCVQAVRSAKNLGAYVLNKMISRNCKCNNLKYFKV
jgi:hypothetical protein